MIICFIFTSVYEFLVCTWPHVQITDFVLILTCIFLTMQHISNFIIFKCRNKAASSLLWRAEDNWGPGLERVYYSLYMGVSKNRVGPQNGWFLVEIPIKMDDLGGKPLFSETRIYNIYIYICMYCTFIHKCVWSLWWIFGMPRFVVDTQLLADCQQLF